MNKFFKDSSIYVFGQIVANLPSFLLIPYLTRKLGADGYGVMSYYIFYMTLFGIFVGLCQDGAVARYFYFYGKRNLKSIVIVGYIYATFISFCILITAYFLNLKIIMLISLISLTQAMLSVQLAIRQCQKKPISYVVIQIATSFFIVFFTIFLLEYFSEDLVFYRFLALFLANLLAVLLAYYFLKGYKIRFSKNNFKISFLYIFSFGFPLVFHHISGLLKGQFDRVLIYNSYSNAQLGIYAAAFNIALIFNILLTCVNKATLPYYYEALKNKKLNGKKIRQLSLVFLPFSFLPVCIILLIPNSVFLWFLGGEFVGTKYYTALFILGFSFVPTYIILVNYLFYYAKNKIISICSVISCIIYLIVLFITSKIDIKFIPLSMIISNLVMLPMLYYETMKIKEEK